MRRTSWLLLIPLLAGCGLLAHGPDIRRYEVAGSAMEPTLNAGQRVTVRLTKAGTYEPARGDIVVFRAPDSWGAGGPDATLIKRVVAVGGDTVACCDPSGRIDLNGTPLDEPYVAENSPLEMPSVADCGSRRFDPVKVAPEQLFLVGDNRLVSVDSRCHGPVPVAAVIGVIDR